MKPTSKTSKETPAKKEAAKTSSAKPAASKAAKPAASAKAAAAKPAAAKPETKAAGAKAEATKSAASKPAAAAAAAKKPAAKKTSATTAAAGSVPMIDTNLAAQTAAAMLLNRPASEGAQAGAGKESSTFKNLKDQLAKPKPASLSNLFGPTGDQKKGSGHFNLNQQKGHNQTFGGMNKTGVPRRTNG